MYRTISTIVLCVWAANAQAHEMTPTYPEMRHSHIEGVSRTTLQIFNKRAEIEFYELGVFDADFNPVQFASIQRIVRIPHLQNATVDIYIRRVDLDRATYICSESKLRRDSAVKTRISSRICSKIKKAG